MEEGFQELEDKIERRFAGLEAEFEQMVDRSKAFEEGIQLRIDAILEWFGRRLDRLRSEVLSRLAALEGQNIE